MLDKVAHNQLTRLTVALHALLADYARRFPDAIPPDTLDTLAADGRSLAWTPERRRGFAEDARKRWAVRNAVPSYLRYEYAEQSDPLHVTLAQIAEAHHITQTRVRQRIAESPSRYGFFCTGERKLPGFNIVKVASGKGSTGPIVYVRIAKDGERQATVREVVSMYEERQRFLQFPEVEPRDLRVKTSPPGVDEKYEAWKKQFAASGIDDDDDGASAADAFAAQLAKGSKPVQPKKAKVKK